MRVFKKIFFVATILSSLGIVNTYAQAPNWLWAKAYGGINHDEGRSIARDQSGNLYVTGSFQSNAIIFGKDTLKNTGPIGTSDVFLVKYDAIGSIMWATGFGGSGHDEARSIAIDGNGNIYIAGGFKSSSVSFGTRTHYNGNKDSADIFLVKFDPQGNVVWSHSAGGRRNDVANSLAADSNGNIYMVGSYGSSKLTFGSHTLENPEDIFDDEHDMFIVKYNKSGNPVWAQTTKVNDYGEVLYKITADKDGNVYMAGSFRSKTITFGEVTLINKDTSGSTSDIIIVKYNAEGSVLWAQSFGGTNIYGSTDKAQTVTTDRKGNIFVTGYFYTPTITFDTITLTNTSQSSLFIIKLDSTSKILWAKAAVGGLVPESTSTITDKESNLIISGFFHSQPIHFGSKKLYNTGNYDMFIAKYNSDGEAIWAQSVGGTSTEVANAITTDEIGNIYATGYYLSPTVSFGMTTFNQEGYGDMFIAKLSANPTSVENEFTNHDVINLFPNPARSTFHISGIEGENWHINIYSLTGEKIYESFLKESQTIDLSGKAKGTYIYQLLKEGEVFKTGKIIVD